MDSTSEGFDEVQQLRNEVKELQNSMKVLLEKGDDKQSINSNTREILIELAKVNACCSPILPTKNSKGYLEALNKAVGKIASETEQNVYWPSYYETYRSNVSNVIKAAKSRINHSYGLEIRKFQPVDITTVINEVFRAMQTFFVTNRNKTEDRKMKRMPSVWQSFLINEVERIMEDPYTEFSKRQYLTKLERKQLQTSENKKQHQLLEDGISERSPTKKLKVS